MKHELILIGGGGHCKACIDVIEQNKEFRIAGIVDVVEKLHHKILGYEVIATDRDIPVLTKEYKFFLVTVGQIKTPDIRFQIYDKLKKQEAELPSIISPLSYVSHHARIGEGTIVMHHAIVNAGAVIGDNCIINTKALIEHDALIGNHCHISTGAIVNGGAQVLSRTFIGSNSVIKEGVRVTEDSCVSFHTKINSSM
jgi:sugar O-acyltransferase (sialic acid O-acetyltransferase NeuD family)